MNLFYFKQRSISINNPVKLAYTC